MAQKARGYTHLFGLLPISFFVFLRLLLEYLHMEAVYDIRGGTRLATIIRAGGGIAGISLVFGGNFWIDA